MVTVQSMVMVLCAITMTTHKSCELFVWSPTTIVIIQYIMSLTLTISENIPKPRNKFWVLCSDAWANLHKTHMCLVQGLGVSVQLKKFQSLFRGFGIHVFSEIVRVTLFSGHTVLLYIIYMYVHEQQIHILLSEFHLHFWFHTNFCKLQLFFSFIIILISFFLGGGEI